MQRLNHCTARRVSLIASVIEHVGRSQPFLGALNVTINSQYKDTYELCSEHVNVGAQT